MSLKAQVLQESAPSVLSGSAKALEIVVNKSLVQALNLEILVPDDSLELLHLWFLSPSPCLV